MRNQERVCSPFARVEAQRSLEMLDREIGLPRPQPEPPAPLPTTSETRIEFQAAVEQGDGDINFFAEIGECVSSLTEDIRIVAGYLKCPPCEIDTSPAILFWVQPLRWSWWWSDAACAKAEP
jgi:hypothetical protein